MADPSRVTQSVVLALVDRSPTPRTTQAAVLAAVEQGGAPRGTQSNVLAAVEQSPAARITDAKAIVVGNLPSKSRITDAKALTVGESSPAPRITDAKVLVLRTPPSPMRLTDALVQALVEETPVPRVTDATVLRVANTAATPRVTQAAALTVAVTAGVPRVSHSVVLVLTRDVCLTTAQQEGELTLELLKRRLARMLGEQRDKPVYWSEAEMERLLNDSYRTLCRDTKVYRFEQTQNTVAGTADYTLDAKTMQVTDVYWDSGTLKYIRQWEKDRFLTRSQPWHGVSGYMQIADQQIRLVEAPQSVKVLKVWAAGIPDDMSLYCDIPEIPCWAHIAVAYGAAALALEKRGEQGDDALSAAYRALYGEYEALLKAYGGTLAEKAHGM